MELMTEMFESQKHHRQQFDQIVVILCDNVCVTKSNSQVTPQPTTTQFDKGVLPTLMLHEARGSSNQGHVQNVNNSSLPKVEIPMFEGTNPRAWVRRCLKYNL